MTEPSSPSSVGNEPFEIPEPEPSRWFWLAVLGLAVILGADALSNHWVPNKWLFGDGSFYMNVSRGLVENFSLRQEAMHPHSWYDRDLGWNHEVDAAWSNIALGRNGEWWPKHPILMPIVAAPFIWAVGPIGSLVFQFACFLLMAVFAYRVAARVATRPAALAAAAAFVATPWIYDRVWGFNNDVFYSVLILAAVDAALGRKAALAGALLGIGVFAKSTNVLYGPAILGIFLLRKDWRGALRMSLFAAGPALVYLGLNWFMYGSPLRTGYDRILVRENGQLGTHSHATDFNFSMASIRFGLQRVMLGGEGFAGKFPLIFAAGAGLVVLAVRRWREALLFAWCIAVPIVFHAPYVWYRLEFNLPQTALAVAPLAALLPPFARPFGREEQVPSRIKWARLVPVLVVVALVLAAIGYRVVRGRQDYFYREVPHASVFLGDIPCDYYNNQTERWECSHYDNDWLMTGRPLEYDLRFGGKKAQVVLFHPHPTGKERRIEYAGVPMQRTLDLRFGFADISRQDAKARFKVQVDDKVLLDEEVVKGGLQSRSLDTIDFAGKASKVVFSATGIGDVTGCAFAFNGEPAK